MRRLIHATVIVAALAAPACGGKGNPPTEPSTTLAGALTAPASPSPAAGPTEQRQAELKGVVEALPPTTAQLTFRAAGKLVTTTTSTTFIEDGIVRTFTVLKLGTPVEVKGTQTGDTFTATRVQIEEKDEVEEPKPGPAPTPPPGPGPGPGPNPPPPAPKPDPQEVEFTGAISGLTGSAASFQFSVGSRLVKGDGKTAIIGDRDAAKSFADLKNGALVEVKGTPGNGFVQASRIHLEDNVPEPEPGDQNEAEVRGTLGAVSGRCPAIASSVGATTFTTSSSTRFDDAACTAFKAGDSVEVRGTRQADGSLAATRLKRR